MQHPKSRKNFPWKLILFGFLCVWLGGRGAYWVVNDSQQGFASLGWQKTTGLVLRTGVKASGGFRAGAEYSLEVEYRYTVAGQEYENNRISFPETRGSGDKAYYQRQLDSKYPTHQPCAVYYNPGNPAESCLEPGVNFFFLAMIGIVSALLFGAGLICLVSGMRGFKRDPSSRHA